MVRLWCSLNYSFNYFICLKYFHKILEKHYCVRENAAGASRSVEIIPGFIAGLPLASLMNSQKNSISCLLQIMLWGMSFPEKISEEIHLKTYRINKFSKVSGYKIDQRRTECWQREDLTLPRVKVVEKRKNQQRRLGRNQQWAGQRRTWRLRSQVEKVCQGGIPRFHMLLAKKRDTVFVLRPVSHTGSGVPGVGEGSGDGEGGTV